VLGEILALTCAAVWGVSVILFKRSEAVSPLAMNLFKNTIGGLLLGATLFATGGTVATDRSLEDWVRIVASGVLGLAVSDTLFLEALKRLGAGMIAILDCIYAPLVALLSVVLLGEKLGSSFVVGAALVVGGLLIATTTAEGLKSAASVTSKQLGDVLLGVAAIAVMAVAVVIVKPVVDRSELIEVTFTRVAIGAVAVGLSVLVFRKDRAEIFRVFVPQPTWRRLVPAAVLGTYVSMLLWLGGIKHTGAATASVLNQLSVLFTLVLARVWLKEPISRRKIAGGVASMAGAVIILVA